SYINSCSYQRIGRIWLTEVRKPIAYGIGRVAVLIVGNQAMNFWCRGYARNRFSAKCDLNCFDNLRRRMAEIHREVNPLPVLNRGGGAASQQRHFSLHQLTVRNDDRVPVPRLNRSLAPTNLFHPAFEIINPDPVANPDRSFHLEGHAAHDVTECILQRKTNHRRDYRGRGYNPS